MDIITDTYVLDESNKRFYVIGLDPEWEGHGEIDGRFLVASCDTGRFSWIAVEDSRLEFDEDRPSGEVVDVQE